MGSVGDLLEAIAKHWIQSHDEIAKTNGRLLEKAIKAAEGVAELGEPPEPPPRYMDAFDQLGCKDVELILHEQWAILPWQHPQTFMGTSKFNGQIKVAELFHDDRLTVRLFYLEAGIVLPQHAKTAREVLHILSAVKAKIGPIEEWTKDICNRFYEFRPTAPQVIQAGEDAPLLYISLWDRETCLVGVKFWFSNLARGLDYSSDIMDIKNVETYYNRMASDYEESMFGWGYCMPEAIADFLVTHGGLRKDSSILDLGCGNGLCGQALHNRGIEDLNGIDFSSEMLKQCAKRAVYNSLQLHDLFKPLPFEDKSFDCVISVAVTTYLKPSVLELWLRVAKTGGLLSFTHKTSVWPDWEKEQDRMEAAGLWRKVWVSQPIPYLPSLKEAGGDQPCQEMAKVYIYKRL